MPLLSVVIPTRDRADRLAGAVASVLAQSMADLEVLVVDDGSVDDTRAVLDRLAASDRRVRCVAGPGGRGPVAARNAGIAASKSAFVAFLDDDDRWAPAKAQRQLDALRSDGALAAVSCGHRDVDERSSRTAVHRPPPSATFDQLLWFNFAGSFSFAMCRRELVADPLDESFVSCQDWDFWLRAARHAPVRIVTAPLCDFTSHRDERISTPTRERDGRRRLLEKYGAEMSPACLAYHEAHLEMQAGRGVRHRARLLGDVARRRSRRAARVVVEEQAAIRVGRLLRDPGRNARRLHALLERS